MSSKLYSCVHLVPTLSKTTAPHPRRVKSLDCQEAQAQESSFEYNGKKLRVTLLVSGPLKCANVSLSTTHCPPLHVHCILLHPHTTPCYRISWFSIEAFD